MIKATKTLFLSAFFAMASNNYSFAKNIYKPKSDHTYITGKRGGCYYINKNGNKNYVDRSLCK